MLTKDVLDSQVTVELPARELMAVFNFNLIFANQQAANYSTQVNALGIGQANVSEQVNVNAIEVYQS